MLYLGADHGGYKLKEFLKKYFDSKKIKYTDLGTYSEELVDYPDIAFKVAKRVAKEKGRGILICGTGTGMCMAANRVKGIRAAIAYDKYSAKMSRRDNDANVLCLRGREVNFKDQIKNTDIWLNTKFSGELRHKRRIAKIK
jgi:ribose 5-phosphate isomerase B